MVDGHLFVHTTIPPTKARTFSNARYERYNNSNRANRAFGGVGADERFERCVITHPPQSLVCRAVKKDKRKSIKPCIKIRKSV